MEELLANNKKIEESNTHTSNIDEEYVYDDSIIDQPLLSDMVISRQEEYNISENTSKHIPRDSILCIDSQQNETYMTKSENNQTDIDTEGKLKKNNTRFSRLVNVIPQFVKSTSVYFVAILIHLRTENVITSDRIQHTFIDV
jgi:hypothetical protein